MEASDLLNTIFKRIGTEFGFDDVNAEFVAFKELKIRWKSSSKWASFEVSDYLANMPENLIEDLAKYVFSKIRNEDRKYPQSVSDWLADPSFLRIYQSLYLKRSGKVLTQSPEGRYTDLRDSYERLIAFELVEKYQVFALNGYARKGADKWLDEWKELDMVSIRDGIIEILLITEEMTWRCRDPIILNKEKDTLKKDYTKMNLDELSIELYKENGDKIFEIAKQFKEFTANQLFEACLPLELSEADVLAALHVWTNDGTAYSPRPDVYRWA